MMSLAERAAVTSAGADAANLRVVPTTPIVEAAQGFAVELGPDKMRRATAGRRGHRDRYPLGRGAAGRQTECPAGPPMQCPHARKRPWTGLRHRASDHGSASGQGDGAPFTRRPWDGGRPAAQEVAGPRPFGTRVLRRVDDRNIT